MKIYKPQGADNYEIATFDHDEDYDILLTLDGQPRAATWRPVKVSRTKAPREAGYPSDFPWMGSSKLIMRRTAVDALRDILDAHGEILPLATDDGVELFIYNAKVVDALDEASSTVSKFPNTDRIMAIKKVAFVKSAIEGLDIFRLSRWPNTSYVSERFVERVNQAGLRGLVFNEVWSD